VELNPYSAAAQAAPDSIPPVETQP
jgi:hypothetical protein